MLITSGNQRAKAEVDCWQPALIETPAMFLINLPGYCHVIIEANLLFSFEGVAWCVGIL